MSKFELSLRYIAVGLVLGAISLLVLAAFSDTGRAQERREAAARIKGARPQGGIPPGQAYTQANLISDVEGIGLVHDPLLVNPWGVSKTATSPFWVANNGSATSTLYRSVAPFTTMVINPGLPSITIPGDAPTGTVANSTADFVLPGPCDTPPCTSRFIFASITGNITGWNPNAPTAGSTTAVIAASQPGHVYTGLAIGSNLSGNLLYAADFANGNIDVYDGTFALTSVSGAFSDPTIPTSNPDNTYHPFNIQNIGGMLYVMYAKVDPITHEEEAGVGFGFVRRFSTEGVRDMTFGIDHGELNAPWGAALAPSTFGVFGNDLLIGNFGEGNPSIHAYNAATGEFLGTMQDEGGDGIEIDELWAITFGNGGSGGGPGILYFTAGIAEEEHGLAGALRATTVTATSLLRFSQDSYETTESGGPINIDVTREGDTSQTATVNYAALTESGAGHAGPSDFTLVPGTLTFNPGETSKAFTVTIINDGDFEGTETLNLVLGNATGAGLASPNFVELSILELPITAGSAEVSGRVVTPGGQGVRNALVTLRDERGATLSAATGSFGYFRIENVRTGHTYLATVRSARYTFPPQVISVVDNVADLEFVGTPR